MGMFFAVKTLAYIAVLLAVSFFVLLGIRKADTKGLKVFGYVIVVLLWISVAVMLLNKISAMYGGGRCPWTSMEKDYKHHYMYEKPQQ